MLISIDKIDTLDSTSTELLDIIDTFLEKGWQVDLYAEGANKIAKNIYQDQSALRLLSVINASFDPVYDLIWVYRAFFPLSLLRALNNHVIKGPIIFRHMFDYTDIYLPYGAIVENMMATRALCLSKAVVEKMLEQGIEAEKINILPYICRTERNLVTKTNSNKLKRLLYASRTFSFEIQDVQQQLLEHGVTLEWLDLSNLQQRISLHWLQNYDVIIGAEEIVPKALCAGIPVYLSTEGRSEGYINEENFAHCDEFHFSCVKGGNSSSANEWVDELLEGYANAAAWVSEMQGHFKAKWDASIVLDALLETSLESRAFTLDEAAIINLELHGRSLLSDMEQKYSVSKWLNERQISHTRRQALTAFIESLPTSGDIAVVIVVDENRSEDLLANTLESLSHQTLHPKKITLLLPTDMVGPKGLSIRHFSSNWGEALNNEINDSSHEAILVIPIGVKLEADAVLLFAEQRVRHPEVLLWYCDEMTHEEGEYNLILKPDCNIDLLRSIPYVGQVILFNRSAARVCGGVDVRYKHLPLLDLLWRLVEQGGVPVIGHIPEVLFTQIHTLQHWFNNDVIRHEMKQIVISHLSRLGVTATVEKGLIDISPRVRYHWKSQPLVSIIIPTRDHFTLLKRCIESLMEKTDWLHYELLIVDNQSVDPDACKFLNDLEKLGLPQLRVLRFQQPFNFAEINNFAATHARGEMLLFLNNDIEVTEPGWLSAMMEHGLRSEVGVVGARLEYEDGRVQSGGMLTGIHLGATAVYEGAAQNEMGYLYYLQSAHNLTSVSGSCMLVRKSVFESVGGFSADILPVYLSDVDFGLKLQKQGYLNVWTPYARLKHMGGATRVLTEKFGVPPRPGLTDYQRLRDRWGKELACDSAYHPALNKMGTPFTLSPNTGRFQPPLPGRPLPVVLANHINWYGCGNHRVIQPFKALEENLLCEGGLIYGVPGIMEVAQQEPDIVLLELTTSSAMPYIMDQFRKISNAKIIVEYDDYLPNLPMKNQNRRHFPQHIIRNLRRVIENADWVVVSTKPLAEAYSKFHSDIRVAQNRLAVKQWGHLHSERGSSDKIRVGWAGGGSHKGDLEILQPIIKALEDQVQWVFMGMKPEGIKCEFHPGVPFDLYPEKLASLNLDLALVPLEINQFNECKSNLRLLEIGTCGVPIIATDIEPYRCGLPVTLVENRFKDWMKAIQAYLNDPALRARQGDALRDAIHRDWYLRNQGLVEWQNAWLTS